MTNIKKPQTVNKTISKTVEPEKRSTLINDTVLVKVRSNFHGTLFYKNLVTKEHTTWDNVGDVQIMSIKDLRDMKSQQSIFFKNQWIVIIGVADGEDDNISVADICKALIISQYYENYIDPTSFEDVCGWDDRQIEENVLCLSVGARDNLIVALNEFISSGKLDSIKKIKAFEKALKCELVYK